MLSKALEMMRKKQGTGQFIRFCINGVIAAAIHYPLAGSPPPHRPTAGDAGSDDRTVYDPALRLREKRKTK
jgi:hypothetical protein